MNKRKKEFNCNYCIHSGSETPEHVTCCNLCGGAIEEDYIYFFKRDWKLTLQSLIPARVQCWIMEQNYKALKKKRKKEAN